MFLMICNIYLCNPIDEMIPAVGADNAAHFVLLQGKTGILKGLLHIIASYQLLHAHGGIVVSADLIWLGAMMAGQRGHGCRSSSRAPARASARPHK